MLHIVKKLTQHTRRLRVVALAFCLLLGVVLTPMMGLVLPTKADAAPIPAINYSQWGGTVNTWARLALTDKLQVGETYTLTTLWKNVSGTFSLDVYGSALGADSNENNKTKLITGPVLADIEGLTYNAKTSQLTYTFTATGTSLTVSFDNKTNETDGNAYVAHTVLKKADGTVVHADKGVYTDSTLTGIEGWDWYNGGNSGWASLQEMDADFFFPVADQWLTGLTVKAGTTSYALDQAFDLWTTEYSVTVPNGTTSVNVTATSAAGSAVVVTGNTGLKEGDNLVQIRATSQNGDEKVYTLRVKVVPKADAITFAAKNHVKFNRNAVTEESLLAAVQKDTGIDAIKISDFAITYATAAATDTDTVSGLPYVSEGKDGAVVATFTVGNLTVPFGYAFAHENKKVETNNVAVAGKDDDKLIYEDNINKTGNIIGVVDGVDKVIVPAAKAYVYSENTWHFYFRQSQPGAWFTTKLNLKAGTPYTLTMYWDDTTAGTAASYLTLGSGANYIDFIVGTTPIEGATYDPVTKKFTYTYTPAADTQTLYMRTNMTGSPCQVYFSEMTFTDADNNVIKLTKDATWTMENSYAFVYQEEGYYTTKDYLPILDANGNEQPITATIRPSFGGKVTKLPVVHLGPVWAEGNPGVDYLKCFSAPIAVEAGKTYTVSALWKNISDAPKLSVFGSAIGANSTDLVVGGTPQNGATYENGRVTYTFTAQGTELNIVMHVAGAYGTQEAKLGDVTVTDAEGNVVFAPTAEYDANGTFSGWNEFTFSGTVYYPNYIRFAEGTYDEFGAEAPTLPDYSDAWNKVKVVMLENGVTPAANTFAVSDGKWTALQVVKLPGDAGMNLFPSDTAYTPSRGFACALAAVNEQVNLGVTDRNTIATNAKAALAARAWNDAAKTAFEAMTINVAEPTLGHTVNEWAVTVNGTAIGTATTPAVTESMMTYMSHYDAPLTEEDFLPSVMYVKDGEAYDWMFDTFVFCAGNGVATDTQFGPVDFIHTGGYRPMTKEIQQDWIDNYIFRDGYNVDALDKAVGEAKEQLGDPTYKANVFLTVFPPIYCPTIHKDGYFDADRTIDIRTQRGREQAVEWLVDAFTEAFNAKGYENVRLGGFYWMAESIFSETPQGINYVEKTLPTATMAYHGAWADAAYAVTVDRLEQGKEYTLTMRYKIGNLGWASSQILVDDVVIIDGSAVRVSNATYDESTSLLTYTFTAVDADIEVKLGEVNDYTCGSIADVMVRDASGSLLWHTEGVYTEADGNKKLTGLKLVDKDGNESLFTASGSTQYIAFDSEENYDGNANVVEENKQGKERPISYFQPSITEEEKNVATILNQVTEEDSEGNEVCKGCLVDGNVVPHEEGNDHLVIEAVNNYVEAKGYSMMFCLYRGAEGVKYMSEYGIDYPSYQPNYFNGLDEQVASRPWASMMWCLEESFYLAQTNGMAVEIEISDLNEASIAANNEYLRLAIKGGTYDRYYKINPVVKDYHNWYIGGGPTLLRMFKESRMDSARRTYDNFYRFCAGILTEDDLVPPLTDRVKQAAEAYILEKGNDITIDELRTLITSLDSDAVINDSYIKYSTPSVTDTDKASDYKLDIKGTDGAVYLDVSVKYELPYNRNTETGELLSSVARPARFTMALVLPSEQEVIDVDTVAVAGADHGLLTYDENGNITGALDAVDKIVIPEGYAGTIAAGNTANFANVKVLIINNTVDLQNAACASWSGLRAVQFSREHNGYLSMVNHPSIFEGCANLRFVQLPKNLAGTGENWHSGLSYQAFWNCTSLETVVWHEGFSGGGGYLGGSNAFTNTALREVVGPKYTALSLALLTYNSQFDSPVNPRNYYAADTALTFPMAVAWAGSAVSEAIAEGCDSEQSLVRAKEILLDRAWSADVRSEFNDIKLSYNGDWLTATGTQHARLTVEILAQSADVSISRAVDSTSAQKDALKATIQEVADAFVLANGNATNKDNLLAALKEATGRDDMTLSDFAMSYARDDVTDTDTEMPYVMEGVDGAVYTKLDTDGISMTLVSIFPCEKVVIETNNVAVAGKDDDKLIYEDNINKTGNIIGVVDGVDKVIVPAVKAYVYSENTWHFYFCENEWAGAGFSTALNLKAGTTYTLTMYWDDTTADTATSYVYLWDGATATTLIDGTTPIEGATYDPATKKLTYTYTPAADTPTLYIRTNMKGSPCQVYFSEMTFTDADNNVIKLTKDATWSMFGNGAFVWQESYYATKDYLPILDASGNEQRITSTIDPQFYGPVGEETKLPVVHLGSVWAEGNPGVDYLKCFSDPIAVEAGKTYTVSALWKNMGGDPKLSVFGSAIGANSTDLVVGGTPQNGATYENGRVTYTFTAQGTELNIVMHVAGAYGTQAAKLGDVTVTDAEGNVVFAPTAVYNADGTFFGWNEFTLWGTVNNGSYPNYIRFAEGTYGEFGAGNLQVKKYADAWNKVKVVMVKNHTVAPATGAFNAGEAATETEEAKLSTKWKSLVALDIYGGADLWSLGANLPDGGQYYFQNHLVANSETLKYLTLPARMSNAVWVADCFYNLPNLQGLDIAYYVYLGYSDYILAGTKIPEFVISTSAFSPSQITPDNGALSGANTVSIIGTNSTMKTPFTFARGAAWALAELNEAVNSGLTGDAAIAAAKAGLVARAWDTDVQACFEEMALSISGNRATVSYKGHVAKAKLVQSIEEGVPQTHMAEGASVRYKEGSSGLRFTSQLYIENFAEKVADGTITEIGTIIVPTDYVARAGEFTLEALDQAVTDGKFKSYMTVTQNLKNPTWAAGTDAESNWYVMQTAMTNIKPANMNRAFSARTYIKMGDGTVVYADYIAADSCRSVKYVANYLLENELVADADKVAVLEGFVNPVPAQ